MPDEQESSWLNKMGDVLGITGSAPSSPSEDEPVFDGAAGVIESEPSPAEGEGSWWDKATDAAEDAYEWATGEEKESEYGEAQTHVGSDLDEGEGVVPTDDEEVSGNITTGGTAGQSAAGETEEKSWWDEATEAVEEAYEWATGDDEDEDEHSEYENVLKAEYGHEEEEGEEVSATDEGESEETHAGSYNETAWDEMSEAERQAWGVLGWDEDKWENGPAPPSASKKWDDLTDAERAAAIALNYKPSSWDGEEGIPDNGWFNESPERQAAWDVLGWGPHNWETGPPPPSMSKTWGELTEREQAAAFALGYDETTWDAEDGSEGGAGALPTIGLTHSFQVGKNLSYLTVESISISAKFAPTKGADREYTGSKEGFEAEAKQELKTQLDGSLGFDEASGVLAISSSGAKGAVGVTGKTELTRGLNLTWEVEINVFQIESYDSTKKQHGKRIGPLVMTPPSIVPKGGISKEVPLMGIRGALSASVAITITPNYDKIALEVGKVLGVRVLQGLGGLAFGIIEAGYQTIVINFKHIIFKVDPYGLTKVRDDLVASAMQGYVAGLRNAQSTGGIMSELYNYAASIGSNQHFDIRAKLDAEGKFDIDPTAGGDLFAQQDAIVNQAVDEAISNGAMADADIRFTVQATWACWQKFNVDHPDTSNVIRMMAIDALWGGVENAPNKVRKQANLPPLDTNA